MDWLWYYAKDANFLSKSLVKALKAKIMEKVFKDVRKIMLPYKVDFLMPYRLIELICFVYSAEYLVFLAI